jgi:hypothetical protein
MTVECISLCSQQRHISAVAETAAGSPRFQADLVGPGGEQGTIRMNQEEFAAESVGLRRVGDKHMSSSGPMPRNNKSGNYGESRTWREKNTLASGARVP